MISISFREQEFIRIGYYIHNMYMGEEEDHSALPLENVVSNSERIIIHEKPRITKFEIKWQEQAPEKEEDKKEEANEKEAE